VIEEHTVGVKQVGIIGAGTMGAGIAQVAATGGCAVQLVDLDPTRAQEAIDRVNRFLSRAVEKGKITPELRDSASANLSPAPGPDHLRDCELIIEAIVEDLEAKVDLLSGLEARCNRNAVFATNTSSLSVTRIAERLHDPGRLVGMHFFNPAPLMPLVEIVTGADSRDSSLRAALETAAAWGKTAVRAKDTPGFIVNRIARPFYLEALRMLGAGLADVATIDRVIRDLGGFRMGPFQLMDLVGIDVNHATSYSVYRGFDKPARLTPHEIPARLLAEGKLGRKTGCGFYDYQVEPPAAAFAPDFGAHLAPPSDAPAVSEFAAKQGASGNAVELYILARVLTGIFNEAFLALEQGTACAEDIGLAMRKGANYPKGPLTWAREIGKQTVSAAFRATRGGIDYPPGDIAAALK
jgi:3-hydroxybutyryl-CoA dehydrogenase